MKKLIPLLLVLGLVAAVIAQGNKPAIDYSAPANASFTAEEVTIPAKGYNRVLIAYEELLPYTQAGVQYRFPLPDCKLSELQFTLQANAAEYCC